MAKKRRGRQRYSENLPAQISNPNMLPDKVTYFARKDIFRIEYTDDLGRRKWKKLCQGDASLSQIHQAYEAQKPKIVTCFRSLSIDFQNSPDWKKLVKSTKRDYLFCHQTICGTKGKNIEFGDFPISQWKKSTVLNYRDLRGEDSPSRANKELTYIKRVLSWAVLYEKIGENIAKDVPKLTVKPKRNYAESKDYDFMMQVAKESGYWYLPYVMELAYECRMRSIEVLQLTTANERERGLYIDRAKGSNDNVTLWSKNLRNIWNEAKAKRNEILKARGKAIPIDPAKQFIFLSERTGEPITSEALTTAKGRVSKMAKERAEKLNLPYKHFTLHDLKRTGITDTKGDKFDAGGHKTRAMLNIYDMSVPEVKTTRESNE